MRDEDIVELYFSRSQQAIAESEKSYGKYCRTIGFNILGNHEDTEECVNETWLRAWDSIPPQRPKKLSAFLGRITRNLAFDKYKASRRSKRGGGAFSQVLEELDEKFSSFAYIGGEYVSKGKLSNTSYADEKIGETVLGGEDVYDPDSDMIEE